MTEQKKRKHTVEELHTLYGKSVSVDRDIFAEQRSNVMLISGNHYSGKTAKSWERLRDSNHVPSDAKLRLTKNHLQKIVKAYLNHIVSSSPGVKIIPNNEKEIQDQKCAQLNDSVWKFCADEMRFPMKVLSFAKDYVDLGETANKVFFNPMAGKFKGYNQKVDELGQPVVDEAGQMVPDESSPVFEGRLEIEKILPTNLLRDSEATSIQESPFLVVRKMVPIADMKKMLGNDPEKIKLLEPSQREEFMVFDSNALNYQTVKDQVLLLEFYFRPGPCYPNGYYYFITKNGKEPLWEGELPFGKFPIHYAGWDECQSTPRHRAVVKLLRPYQLEINRTASKIAEHQVTSDDKLLIQSGTKIASGGILPGVRAIQYSGTPPTVLEGRAGAQYLDYMQSQITEMYQVAGLEELVDKQGAQADPYGMLYKSVKEQKKFTIYIEKFEAYLKETVETFLELAKQYMTEDMLIPMVGKAEYVNIPEFKSSESFRSQVKVMPMANDINSMFGKWLAINHTIQYVGQNLGKDDIGKLLRQVPFGNFEESFGDFTLEYDLANNYILALERGEWQEPSASDDKNYMLKRLEKRTRESDFRYLNPQIQQMFEQAKQIYKEMVVQEKLELQRAQQGFIPMTGPLIKTDLQVEEPNSTGGTKTTRMAFPIDALKWLMDQSKAQGTEMNNFLMQDDATQADIARQISDRLGLPMPSMPENQQITAAPQMLQGVQNGVGTKPTNR